MVGKEVCIWHVGHDFRKSQFCQLLDAVAIEAKTELLHLAIQTDNFTNSR